MTFWNKFAHKGYFQSKSERVNFAIGFCIFELFWVANLSLNWQFWLFGRNLTKKGISGLKENEWTWSLNSAYSNCPGYQILAEADNLHFVDQISSKRVFLVWTEKVKTSLNSAYWNHSRYQVSPETDNFDKKGKKILQKGYFLLKTEKTEQHHWICAYSN